MFHYNNSRLFRLHKNTLTMKLHLREIDSCFYNLLATTELQKNP